MGTRVSPWAAAEAKKEVNEDDYMAMVDKVNDNLEDKEAGAYTRPLFGSM
jgi:hypothetical protein